jgi:hypothetical protein
MKRVMAVIGCIALLGVACASPALASSDHKIPYQAGPYSMAADGSTDFWTCTGFRLDAGATVQDHFHCTVADQTFTGTFTANNPWPCGCTGWLSDYDGAFTDDYVIRVSSNGSVTGTAIYEH